MSETSSDATSKAREASGSARGHETREAREASGSAGGHETREAREASGSARGHETREAREASGSARGHETRRRILRAALTVFGDDGYERATTRRIAGTAGVALPAIKYYFENKEGLYLACAHEIVARYQDQAGEYLASVVADLESGCPPETARSHLKRVLRLVSAIADAGSAGAATSFVLREMSAPGPAFEVLYRELWRPGVELTAWLVARAQGDDEPDPGAHLRALMFHASLTAFTVTLPVSLRYLDDTGGDGGSGGLVEALALIDAEIDRLGRPPD